MVAIMKINGGTAERLVKWKTLKPEEPRNLKDEELTLEIKDEEVLIELHKKDVKKMLEISDVNGSFGLWLPLNNERIEKLKQIVGETGP